MSSAKPSIITRIQKYLTQYVVFSSEEHSLVAALWVAATHVWTRLDVFPYLQVTAATKQAGKTRLLEVLSFVAANARNFAAMTPPMVFRSIRDEKPTLFIDEAESMSRSNDMTMRAVLNTGYRRGASVPRNGKGGIEYWPTFCPKAFALIGDLNDTLRDRCIIIRLQRSPKGPPKKFVWDMAEAEGHALRDELATLAEERIVELVDAYQSSKSLDFLRDRDEEIWAALFATAQVLDAAWAKQLPRIAVDMATEKTASARRYVELEGAEQNAEDEEFSVKLLRDLSTVLDGKKAILTRDALTALQALDTAPWRKFRGRGIQPMDMQALLSAHGVAPCYVRVGKEHGRGYKREDVTRGLNGLK